MILSKPKPWSDVTKNNNALLTLKIQDAGDYLNQLLKSMLLLVIKVAINLKCMYVLMPCTFRYISQDKQENLHKRSTVTRIRLSKLILLWPSQYVKRVNEVSFEPLGNVELWVSPSKVSLENTLYLYFYHRINSKKVKYFFCSMNAW